MNKRPHRSFEWTGVFIVSFQRLLELWVTSVILSNKLYHHVAGVLKLTALTSVYKFYNRMAYSKQTKQKNAFKVELPISMYDTLHISTLTLHTTAGHKFHSFVQTFSKFHGISIKLCTNKVKERKERERKRGTTSCNSHMFSIEYLTRSEPTNCRTQTFAHSFIHSLK